ncbi:MAG: hypothetical protein MUF84_08140 [Anaerolineae bacterium]|nr:hypothetical protein [Anaerolineae bacterium]
MKRQFENVEQRMVTTYLDTFPSFVPAVDGPAVEAQAQFYAFMKGLYQRLAEAPMLLVSELHEDDAYPNRFNGAAYGKPKLRDWMRKPIKEVDGLLATMVAMGEAGRLEGDRLVVGAEVKVSRKARLLLQALGLEVSAAPDGIVLRHDEYPELFPAWIWMATRPGASQLSFSRCLFREGHPYAGETYGRLSGNEAAFQRLEAYLIENGYTRVCNWDGEVSLDYWKSHDGKVPTRSGYLFAIRHIGIAARYDPLIDEPQVFGMCIPRMKEILLAFDSLDAGVQDFMMEQTKPCDGCRYCAQTDKTGKRPLANVPVTYGGKTTRLCPYYPGFSYSWPELNDTLVDNMVAMLRAMDRLFDGA